METPNRSFETITLGVLTVCTYTEFAPFSYEKQGEIAGTDITLLSRFAQSQGLTLRLIKKGEFANLWHTPGNGECDVAAAGMARLARRNLGERGVWSIPYRTVQRSLLIRRGDADLLKTPADFSGKKIVVTPDSTAHFDAIERYQPLGATIIATVPSQAEIVRQLLHGEVDAFGEGDVSNGFLASQYWDETGEPLLVLTDLHPMTQPEELRFAVRAQDGRLLAYLNEFIAGQPIATA